MVLGRLYSTLLRQSRRVAAARPLYVLTEFWLHGMRSAGGDPEWFFTTLERLRFIALWLPLQGRGPRVSCEEFLPRLPPFKPEAPDSSYINLLFEWPAPSDS